MSQLERLQSLLERVQHNRAQPRSARHAAVGAVEPVVVHSTVQATAVPTRMASGAPNPPIPVPAPPRSASSAPPPVRRGRASTPREHAVEIQPAERAVTSIPPPPPPPSRPPAQATGPQRIDGELPKMSRPIAQVISPAPRIEQPTFGELLKRSLALRPR